MFESNVCLLCEKRNSLGCYRGHHRMGKLKRRWFWQQLVRRQKTNSFVYSSNHSSMMYYNISCIFIFIFAFKGLHKDQVRKKWVGLWIMMMGIYSFSPRTFSQCSQFGGVLLITACKTNNLLYTFYSLVIQKWTPWKMPMRYIYIKDGTQPWKCICDW